MKLEVVTTKKRNVSAELNYSTGTPWMSFISVDEDNNNNLD